MHRYALAPLALLLGLLISCGDDSPRLDEDGESVSGLESEIKVESPTFNITNILRASGLKVRIPKHAERPPMQADGYVVDVNDGVILEVFEYESADELTNLKNQISADGASIGGKAAEWDSPVHFYNTEKVIIAYLGNDAETRQSLATLFGPEFAGTK